MKIYEIHEKYKIYVNDKNHRNYEDHENPYKVMIFMIIYKNHEKL